MTSVNTWTLEGLSSEDLGVIERAEVWRFVEAQHVVATTSLVDNWQEQELLENILEDTKPPVPSEASRLDFLRMTPFRYRPVKGVTSKDNGSRFRASGDAHGVFYGAFDTDTAAYETAFYRGLFFSESPGMVLPQSALIYTAFRSEVTSAKVLDLTKHPVLSKFCNLWESSDNYRECQNLAEQARSLGVEAIIYKSVRDPQERNNIAILTPQIFTDPQPNHHQTWSILCNRHGMQIACDLPKKRLSLSFSELSKMGDNRFKNIGFSKI